MRERGGLPNPLLVAVILYLTVAVAWTRFFFVVVGPILSRAFAGAPPTQAALVSLVATGAGELLLPIALYVFIVRPYRLTPILPSRDGTRRWPARLFALGGAAAVTLLGVMVGLGASGWITGAKFAVVGLTEEWSYRGVLTRLFRDRIGLLGAAVVISLLFGAAHWAELTVAQNIQVLSPTFWSGLTFDFLFGLAATFVVWRSGSIWWAALLHAVWDWSQSTPLLGAHLPSWVLAVAVVLGTEIIARLGKVPPLTWTSPTESHPGQEL